MTLWRLIGGNDQNVMIKGDGFENLFVVGGVWASLSMKQQKDGIYSVKGILCKVLYRPI